MMLQGICLKMEFVEFVIQILKMVGLWPRAQGCLGVWGRGKAPHGTDRSLLGLGFQIYIHL
jgi:hypothetical protein